MLADTARRRVNRQLGLLRWMHTRRLLHLV
jgi:hypothetical protein